MSLLVRRFADFLHDLQQLERSAPRGDAILDAFTRHTPFEGGAVYLRDRDSILRLPPEHSSSWHPRFSTTTLP